MFGSAADAVPTTWEVVRGVAATRVALVRHGETEWNARGVYQGSRDVALSAHGRAQAAALALRLAPVAFDAVYTSPLARARETAEVVLAGRGPGGLALVAHPVPAFGEFGYGAWEGVAPDERRARWPDLDARWSDDPWTVTPPGGESLAALAARVLPAWNRLLGEHAGGTIAVFAHGHVNRVILLHARALPREAFWSVAQPNASAVLLDCRPDATAVSG
ncbi:MAG TPA: histidine phosphatase family protein [Gemmatirosa sp.]